VKLDKFSRITRIRMLWCAIYALVLLLTVAWIAPQQVPVIVYKLNLILLASVTGYWLDRWAFPYARPDRFLTADGEVKVNHKRVFGASLVRRAIIMGAAMLAVGMGL
jgi:fatty acid desaturase